ncbi:MAG TPA: hypothetical protein VMS31_02555 [Pyrinomonadaceae bacterium]|nr:hypothetical protein [Pyrinomonadaceae bacterium]
MKLNPLQVIVAFLFFLTVATHTTSTAQTTSDRCVEIAQYRDSVVLANRRAELVAEFQQLTNEISALKSELTKAPTVAELEGRKKLLDDLQEKPTKTPAENRMIQTLEAALRNEKTDKAITDEIAKKKEVLAKDSTLLQCIQSKMSMSASGKVQCSCQKIPADGEGNTSCSAAESGSRCTIDFNLFGRESETRAAELLRKYGRRNLTQPDPGLSPSEAVRVLSSRDPQQLVDAVLIYMVVAAGNQSVRVPQSVPLDGLEELVDAVRSDKLTKSIEAAFNEEALNQSSKGGAFPVHDVGRATVSPGCVEFTTSSGLWMMFKANWSAARLVPTCRNNPK